MTKVVGTPVGIIAVGGAGPRTSSHLALVTQRTHIAVVAGFGVGKCLAPNRRITEIVGAGIVVVAVEDASGYTDSLAAQIVESASVSIAACAGFVDVNTTQNRAASVGGTTVAVVTVQRQATGTKAADTRFSESAFVAVVARTDFCGVFAPRGRITTVGGTRIVVVAVEWCSADAVAAQTLVGGGAHVVVIAATCFGGMHTAGSFNTAVGGTGIVVFTNHGASPGADAVVAGVVGGARVIVVTCSALRYVSTPAGRRTTVGGTGIRVITYDRLAAAAETTLAEFPLGAGVGIVACGCIGHISAPCRRIAAVVSTGVVVGAGNGFTGLTCAAVTEIPVGTGIFVVAVAPCWCKNTSLDVVATIGRTWIVVVTYNHCAAGTNSRGTGIG